MNEHSKQIEAKMSCSDPDLEPSFELLCQVCEKAVEAMGFCWDCKIYLCDGCLRYHRKIPISRNHVLLDHQTMPRDPDSASLEPIDICTEKCKEHEGEIIKYYCSTHKHLACSVCVTLDHRTCDIVYIPKKSRNFTNDNEYVDFRRKLQELLQKSVHWETCAEIGLKKADEMYAQVLKDIRGYRKAIDETLDRLEDTIKKKAERFYTQDIEKFRETNNIWKKAKEELQALSVKSDRLVSKNQFCELFTYVINSKSTMEMVQKESNKINSDYLRTTEYALVQRNLQQILVQLQNARKLYVLKCSHAKDIEVRSTDYSEECDVASAARIPGNKLVITNSNSQCDYGVKVIDLCQETVAQEGSLASRVWDVVLFQTNKLVVTKPHARSIVFLTSDDRGNLTKYSEVELRSPCWGIASYGDKLVVTLRCPERVEIIDETGKTLQSFSKNEKGENLFSFPRYVAISADGQSVYVSDYNKNTVTSLGLDGHVRASYKDKVLAAPTKIVVDTFGVVYVSGEDSHNIHMLTPALDKIKILLRESDGIYRPLSLHLCENTGKLYVGMHGSGKLRVFQFSS